MSVRAYPVVLAAAMVFMPACTQREAGSTATRTTTSDSDREFAGGAAQMHMTSAHLAQMAQTRGQSTDVKDFARSVHRDHRQAYEKLSAIAQRENIDIPRSIDSEHQRLISRFEGYSGPEFDRQFLQHQSSGREQIRERYRSTSTEARESSFQSYANEFLPALVAHAERARSLEGRITGHAAGTAERSTEPEASMPEPGAPPPGTSSPDVEGPAERSETLRHPERGQSTVRYGTIVQLDAGRVLEVRPENQPGTFLYRLAEDRIASSIPQGLRVGDLVKITESTDAEGRYSIWVERATKG